MFCCNCSTPMHKIERSEQELLDGPYDYHYICNQCGTLTGLAKQQKLIDGKVTETEFYISRSFIKNWLMGKIHPKDVKIEKD